MLTRWQTGVLAAAWLGLAFIVLAVFTPPLFDDAPMACTQNYGHVEWTVVPPGPVCVNEASPVPEDRLWGWTSAVGALVLSAPALVLSARHPRPTRRAVRPALA